MTTDDDRYLGLPDLARYSGLSASTLQRHLKDPIRPIPHARIGGRVLVRRSEFDAWVAEASATPQAAPLKARQAYARSTHKPQPAAAWYRKLAK